MAFFLSASSRPAISFCNLQKRDEACRKWARLAVPAAAVEAPAHAVTETATKTRMHKAGASEPRMEEARVTKAEASEVWTEKAAAEPAVPASAKSDGNSDRPSPAPWVTPIPARCIIRVIPGVILWRIIRIALCLNGGASRYVDDSNRRHSHWLPRRTSHRRVGLAGLDSSRRRGSDQIRIRLRLEHYVAGRTAEHDRFRLLRQLFRGSRLL